jgi:hypothetical protein
LKRLDSFLGKTQVLDGPTPTRKRSSEAFNIIEVADLDAAISWAGRSPTAIHGIVEVRPLLDRAAHEHECGRFALKEHKGEETCGN